MFMKPKVYVTRHLPQVAREELEAACEVTIWDEEFPPPYEVIVENITDKEGLVCLLTDRIDADLMDAAPNLKVIAQVAVGFDNIDVAAATARGIRAAAWRTERRPVTPPPGSAPSRSAACWMSSHTVPAARTQCSPASPQNPQRVPPREYLAFIR